MEKLPYEKSLAKRGNGDTIRRARFRIASRLYLKEACPLLDCHQFRFSASWLAYNLSITMGITPASGNQYSTKTSRRLPSINNRMLRFNRQNPQPHILDTAHAVGRFLLSHIVNIDQTPPPFECLSGRTYALKGDKQHGQRR